MSRRDSVARIFRRNYRRWVSAIDLLRPGGLLAWRTEVSRCRTELGMRIEQKTHYTKRGSRSFYRYLGRRKAA